MAFTPFVESDLPSMANFNEKFLECIAEAVGQAPHIKTGSYIGTGAYGSANPNTLIFDFEPKIVFVTKAGYYASDPSYGAYSLESLVPFVYGSSSLTMRSNHSNTGSGGTATITYTINKNKITWYISGGTYYQNANVQLNTSGTTYFYVAIG